MGKRIAHIAYSFLPIRGGGDVYLKYLYETLYDAGFEQVIYQRSDKELVWAELSAFGGKLRPILNIKTIYNPFRWYLRRGEFWTHSLPLSLYIKEFKNYDYIIVQYPLYFLPISLLLKHKCIVISHGVTWDDLPNSWRSKIKKLIAAYAFNHAFKFVANDTNFFRQLYIRIAPKQAMFQEVKPNRWFIPNCVDTDRFNPEGSRIPEISNLLSILVPRNFFYNRGLHLAISAFKILLKSLPEAFLFIVGGGGQNWYREFIFRQAEALGLTRKVIFYGQVEWEDMPAVYRSAKVTLIPSICGEGTSYSALESMACGTPVVSTNIGGLSDLPTFQVGVKPEAIASALMQVVERHQQISQQQRTQVFECYNLSLWKEAWLKVLKE